MNIPFFSIIAILLFGLILSGCKQDSLFDPTNPSAPRSSPSRIDSPDPLVYSGDLPHTLALYQPYPNPSRDLVVIMASIPIESFVVIVVQNPVGDVLRVLVSETLSPGYHRVDWDGRNSQGNPVKDGDYFISMQAGSFLQSRLVKIER